MSRQITADDGVTDPGMSSPETRILGGIVITVALVTCLFIVAVPMFGSLLVAAVILAVFAGVGLAAVFALSLL